MEDKIVEFLEQNNIEYATFGNNVGKGCIAINCPFCFNDPSNHLNISLDSGRFVCWRDSEHKGDFIRLIQRVLNCSWIEAKRIGKNDTLQLEQSALSELLTRLEDSSKEEKIETPKILKFDKSFYSIKNTGSTKRFYQYLQSRGFDDVDQLIQKYGLRCSLTGYWRFRVIIPVFYNNILVSWTGRSIYEDSELRYLDLSKDNSVRALKTCLFNYDSLQKGGDTLVLVEGPFDALKIDFYGIAKGIKATCLFTKTVRDEQIKEIGLLARKFRRVVILLDEEVISQSEELKRELSFLKTVEKMKLPEGVVDPGELIKEQIDELFV